MDRYNFYYLQKVKESELDAAFDAVENAIAAFLEGFQYIGIVYGAAVTEHSPTPNLTVDVEGPALVYDQSAQRIAWNTTQVIDITIDENGSATAVGTSGNEKYLSIFAEFDRNLSDPRTDGFGATVFFDNAESYKINVVQGTEAPTGTATKPALRGDQILLADVLITYSMTQVQNSDIDDSRSQVPFDLTGSPLSIKEKSMQDALQAMLDQLNTYATGNATLAGNNVFTGTDTFNNNVAFNDDVAFESGSIPVFTSVPTFENGAQFDASAQFDDGLTTTVELEYDASHNYDHVLAGNFLPYMDASGVPAWRNPSNYGSWYSRVNSGELYVQFQTPVLDSAVTLYVDVIIEPGATRTGTDRVHVQLVETTPNFSSPYVTNSSVINDAYDDGTTNKQLITVSGSVTPTSAKFYGLLITAGNDGGTNFDQIAHVRIRISHTKIAPVMCGF